MDFLAHANATFQGGLVKNALESLVDDYLSHCLSVGRKRNTVEGAYGYPLRQVFLPWCAAQGITEIGALTTRTIERYQAELLRKGEHERTY